MKKRFIICRAIPDHEDNFMMNDSLGHYPRGRYVIESKVVVYYDYFNSSTDKIYRAPWNQLTLNEKEQVINKFSRSIGLRPKKNESSRKYVERLGQAIRSVKREDCYVIDSNLLEPPYSIDARSLLIKPYRSRLNRALLTTKKLKNFQTLTIEQEKVFVPDQNQVQQQAHVQQQVQIQQPPFIP